MHIWDLSREGTVLEHVAPSSYSVLTDKGVVRRNRFALISMKDRSGEVSGAEGTIASQEPYSPVTARGAEGSPNSLASPSCVRVSRAGGAVAGSTASPVNGKVYVRPEHQKRLPRRLEDYDLS